MNKGGKILNKLWRCIGWGEEGGGYCCIGGGTVR